MILNIQIINKINDQIRSTVTAIIRDKFKPINERLLNSFPQKKIISCLVLLSDSDKTRSNVLL